MNHELRFCAARSAHKIDIEFLPAGLHERPEKLNHMLKEVILSIDSDEYDYILLNYGLCGNGTLGVFHPSLPIVIHNAHDCIPLLIGDADRHKKYVEYQVGTFYYSCGWIEELLVPGCPDYMEKYAELYGRMISQQQRDTVERILLENYTHLAYIYWKELGSGLERKGREYTTQCLQYLNNRYELDLRYDEIVGEPGKIQCLVDASWQGEDFIIVEPGRRLGFNAPLGTLCIE
jgi:hypothetical protein